MKDNRGRSILAGIILGFLLGFWIYYWPAYFLVCGPIEEMMIPSEIRIAFGLKALIFGSAPGALIGFIGGLVLPFHHPRGHMAKSIGAFSWIPITGLAWWTQWDNVAFMSGGRIAITIVVTIISLAVIIPMSGWLGNYIERIRE